MKNLASVEGHNDLYRDLESGAIINTDNVAYEQYLTSVSSRMNTKKEIENLKSEISEIKVLLKEILNESRKD